MYDISVDLGYIKKNESMVLMYEIYLEDIFDWLYTGYKVVDKEFYNKRNR
jgi:hypothetical protein